MRARRSSPPCPAYLNSLSGKGVHLVTVNDYLAKRDSEWMGRIYRVLGVQRGSDPVGDVAAAAHARVRRADITYGTNNEFGFDYLRDNMAMRHRGLRPARLPVRDRGRGRLDPDRRGADAADHQRQVADSAKWYQTFARIAPRLKRDEDYEVEESKYQVAVTESGVAKVEEMLGIENLYEHVNTPLVHHLQNALRAKELYKRDVAYVVVDGEVKIVDEFTGRVLEGRRYSEGLHQAIEAKEGVRIKEENQTLATITIQNYFKMYDKLSGMTGTAKTQLTEFEATYKIGVVEIPTNRPNVRDDEQDLIFKNEDAKWNALARRHHRAARGRSADPGRHRVDREVRAAVHHAQPARRPAPRPERQEPREGSHDRRPGRAQGRGHRRHQHGRPRRRHPARRQPRVPGATGDGGARIRTTTATCCSRWTTRSARPTRPSTSPSSQKFQAQTDAEHDEVVELGGLYVLGTERHESRRIDNQLRGRSGRQGDPGESRSTSRSRTT